jgi:hypothetical protein
MCRRAASAIEGDVGETLRGGAQSHRQTSSKRVALAFYGLTRSLQYTVDSIKENVMDKLTAAGYKYDVYLHTYDLNNIENLRSGEANRLNTSEWTLLKPDHYRITSQVRESSIVVLCCYLPGTHQNT